MPECAAPLELERLACAFLYTLRSSGATESSLCPIRVTIGKRAKAGPQKLTGS
jgi:hypothetical protein